MYYEYEEKLLALKEKIDNLAALYRSGNKKVERELRSLYREFKSKAKKTYSDLSPWERVQLARHPRRPHTLDYIKYLIKNFIELHGDRRFGDDKAIVAGFGYFRGEPVCVIGHEKGRGTQEKIERNFGMPHPEGYRKAIRVMKLAESYKMPVITFIDTPGAFPGIGAEERGQSEAIAQSMLTMGYLKVPTVAVVIGEGGSGGALALGVADRVCIMENAYYSVISPEGCAAILWKEQDRVKEAAKALKLTAKDLYELGVVDCIIKEPFGAAHWDHKGAAYIVGYHIRRCLQELCSKDVHTLISERVNKFKSLGAYMEG
ncbi:acetyl-CoA carboxylase carboxyl transferase subunit alpha [Hydrogenivirga caldilitoris]|uniref:Acetyl-coenzyme A carboxylase carboxyl transferase subunit alpha n=1 Tax=Hydrogenivirga caldilitoris TaxID=246264 RepID=A0A497XQY7_9AQUI|nr:acetyl-CoA carboxylase carboxyltransferase subunit alpha [Hydrogenivirga caldilitoris]RLJ71385.1 acetyl-CoA carboxylase carboxyl transferase subunit alpha [Hydrogenivirga caldilitoris]